MTRLLVLSLLLASASARAEAEPESYRKQMIVVDVIGLAATAVGLVGVGKAGWQGPFGAALMVGGIGTYFIGSPVVHRLHGNPVLPSIGLRLAPIAIALVVTGVADDCEGGHECAWDGVAEGAVSLLVTVPAVLAIDWLWLAKRDVAPAVSVHGGAPVVGVAGRW